MSKLDDLIKEYCPNGVEYKPIEDITIRLKGMNITAEQMKKLAYSGGDILVFGGGNTVVNIRKQDLDHNKIIYIPSILCQSRGTVDFKYVTQPYTFKNEMWAYIPKEDNLSIKFLYFFLKSKVPILREEANKMGAMPQICISKINEMIQIPIPPLEIQEYIVSILEPLEAYTAELTAELTARKAQYEGMLSKVMSKEEVSGEGIEHKKIRDIFTSYAGLSGKTKNDFNKGIGKFITYKDVYDRASISAPSGVVDITDKDKKQNRVVKNDLLVTTSSETKQDAGHFSVYLNDDTPYLNSFCFGLRPKSEGVSTKYIAYLLKSRRIHNLFLDKCVNGEIRYNVSKKSFMEFEIPIPPLPIQEKVVSWLEPLEELTTDLQKGLPRTIELYKQKYEYNLGYIMSKLKPIEKENKG